MGASRLAAAAPRIDRGTRLFWRHTGRRVDLEGEQSWLRAPVSQGPVVADRWLTDAGESYGGQIRTDEPGAGLLDDLRQLDGPGFAAADLRPEIAAFYHHTSQWRMEVWTQWSAPFAPAGALVSRLFGRRVQQLSIPTRPLEVAHGMDSRITVIADAQGRQQAAAWIRTLRSTGEYVYSGCYSVRALPGSDRPSVHVAFPLEQGNVQVFLRPSITAGGGLLLTSGAGRFGQDGAYVVVREGGTYAARAPIRETFHLYVDTEGTLRTDHVLSLWSAPAVRLHYKLLPPALVPVETGIDPEM